MPFGNAIRGLMARRQGLGQTAQPAATMGAAQPSAAGAQAPSKVMAAPGVNTGGRERNPFGNRSDPMGTGQAFRPRPVRPQGGLGWGKRPSGQSTVQGYTAQSGRPANGKIIDMGGGRKVY